MLIEELVKVFQDIGKDVKTIRQTLTGKANKGEFVTRAEVESIVDDKLNALVVDEVSY